MREQEEGDSGSVRERPVEQQGAPFPEDLDQAQLFPYKQHKHWSYVYTYFIQFIIVGDFPAKCTDTGEVFLG